MENDDLQLNDAGEGEVIDQEVGEDTTDWKAEALKYKAIAQRNKNKIEKVQSASIPQPDLSGFVRKEELDETLFFERNPDYNPYKDIIKGIKKDGETLSQAIENDAFKALFEKAKKADEIEKTKSVLHTNPRIGKATDKFGEAKEAKDTGNNEEAGRLAVKGVIEAFEL